jgi:hypothetical protein
MIELTPTVFLYCWGACCACKGSRATDQFEERADARKKEWSVRQDRDDDEARPELLCILIMICIGSSRNNKTTVVVVVAAAAAAATTKHHN